jgi:hypothetical protein
LLKNRRVVIALGALVVIAGCGTSAALAGVAVTTVQTDILFGTPPTPSPSPAEFIAFQPPAPQPPPDYYGGAFNFGGISAPATCNTASPNSFPAESAGPSVSTLPATGQYRWVMGGTYSFAVGGSTVKVPLPQYENHYLRNAKTFTDALPAPPGSASSFDFKYQTIEPRNGPQAAGFWLFYWQVKASSPVPNDPEGGLVLKRIDMLDSNGKGIGTYFDADPSGADGAGGGLMILPLPVQPGTTINSAAADSQGNPLTFQGTVGQRKRIDACGDRIEGWEVTGSMTSGANSANVDIIVAPQYGAQIIEFDADGTWLGTTYNKMQAHSGQLNPDPLPAMFK